MSSLTVIQRMTMDAERNKEVIREFGELGDDRGNLSRLDELCAPDIVNHALAPGRPQGIEGTREFLQTARRGIHPARWLWSETAAENDLVVQFGSRELDWPGGLSMAKLRSPLVAS